MHEGKCFIRLPCVQKGEECAGIGVVPRELGWPLPRPLSTAEQNRRKGKQCKKLVITM